MSQRWSELVVTLDERGLDALSNAASRAIESLHRSPGPRSNLSPSQLHELVWSLDICPEEGVELANVLKEMSDAVWSNCVVPSDPMCVAHLHPPTLLAAVVSELTTASTNQSMDSWDQAPSGTEVELHLMHWLGTQLGLPPSSSGVMTSGGTASNLLGITLARSMASSRLGVDVLKSGLPLEASKWRIIGSDQSHFSVQRAAAQLGLGRDAVIAVRTDPSGAMNLEQLDEVLEQLRRDALIPIAIVGTAGTTDLGVIDPLYEIAERALEHNMWFHVDAAVGGAFVLSQHLRPRLRGIERADSVTVDFHKLWWQPFNASALVVRDVAAFDLLRVKSNYLDRGDEIEGMVNLVGRSLDTSRCFDAAKVVTSLRTIGRRTMGEMLEYLVDLTTYAGQQIEQNPKLHLLSPPTSVMCVFDAENCDADGMRTIQQRLLARGEVVLGRTEIKGRAALKFTFMNPLATKTDVDRLLAMVLGELENL